MAFQVLAYHEIPSYRGINNDRSSVQRRPWHHPHHAVRAKLGVASLRSGSTGYLAPGIEEKSGQRSDDRGESPCEDVAQRCDGSRCCAHRGAALLEQWNCKLCSCSRARVHYGTGRNEQKLKATPLFCVSRTRARQN